MKVSETSENYEKLAKTIYTDILASDGVENIDVQHNVKILGKSGVEHQIDVYWECKYAGISHKVLIECKHYSHKVGLLHVRNMHGLLMDIPNSSGILITTEGYQSGAERYASYYEIGLKLIRPPKGEDWDGCIQIINVDMQFYMNNYLDLKCDIDGNHAETKEIAEQDPSLMPTNSNDILIQDEGCEPCTLVEWLDRNTSKSSSEIGIEVEKTIIPKESYLPAPDGKRLKIGRIWVKYITSCIEQNLHLDHMSFVHAVLEDFKTKEVEHMYKKT